MAFFSPVIQRPRAPRSPVAQAALLMLFAASAAVAQQGPTLKPVIVNERTSPAIDVTGFGDFPSREVPVSATTIDRSQIENAGARRLADLTKFDASVSDSYNAPGYWDFINIRGYELDPRYNYRREGLPVSGETVTPLDNKERVEILKGTSGIQAGTSAPGGLVNYVVKRPTENPLREVTLGVSERGSTLLKLDLGGRSENKVLGYRLNVAQETLRPRVDATDGRRSLVAFAGDMRLGGGSLLQGEFEWSSHTQASVPGQSLLGPALPPVLSPNININNQSWSQANDFDNLTGTLRFEQALGNNWTWSAQYGAQSLKTNDRLAYPFGCFDAGTGNYYADRYCPDTATGTPNVGLADIYDFRSENEKRRQQAAQLKLQGSFALGSTKHNLSTGVLYSVLKNRFGFQTDDSVVVGQATTDGRTQIPAASPALAFISPNTDRDERSTELFVHDVARWGGGFTSWLGLRHTRIERSSVRTDGSRATSYSQGFTTPWLGASYEITPAVSVYGSWGRGIESEVAPGRSRYANAGVALPAIESTQMEVGLKGGTGPTQWQLALFDIKRPVTSETQLVGVLTPGEIAALCPASPADCRLRGFDGNARHRGLEASINTQVSAWKLGAALSVINAKRTSADPTINGRRPVNVPDYILRANAEYAVTALPGLSLAASVSREGERMVVDSTAEQVSLPAWTRVDALVRYEHKLSPGTQTTWLVGVDNLFNKTYWRESPTKFGHIYLYPGAERTLRVSMRTAF
ncbi:MAG: TonB-dependent siderophore receptor [Pseudomonadota bacterium]